ncbi:hypothetical protein A1D31_34715 [Bradyrhizobium liaoningense]|nr:hypothetical protein A1D31_34715 [Bradyrhizobium liaoningense]
MRDDIPTPRTEALALIPFDELSIILEFIKQRADIITKMIGLAVARSLAVELDGGKTERPSAIQSMWLFLAVNRTTSGTMAGYGSVRNEGCS